MFWWLGFFRYDGKFRLKDCRVGYIRFRSFSFGIFFFCRWRVVVIVRFFFVLFFVILNYWLINLGFNLWKLNYDDILLFSNICILECFLNCIGRKILIIYNIVWCIWCFFYIFYYMYFIRIRWCLVFINCKVIYRILWFYLYYVYLYIF